jgi:futalosine hydrolase
VKTLVVTAVEAEAAAVGTPRDGRTVIAGVGRVNAAAATTLAIIAHGPFDCVLSVGLAGALPGGNLHVGDIIAADYCVYAEEGIQTPDGFQNMAQLGWPLGDFTGNDVPCDPGLVRRLRDITPIGRIATVATCSGTDALAIEIAARTQCAAEAMEGAAVVHAARLLNVPAIEIRVISNTTGERDSQVWDREQALATLAEAMPAVLERLIEPAA